MKKHSVYGTALAAVLLMIIVFSLGCSPGPSSSLTGEEMKAYALDSPSRGIRILTINVWTGLTYKGFLRIGEYPNDPNKRYELLVREIRSLDPDIIAIQEANPLPYYAKRIATDLGYQVVYRAALGGIRLGPIGFPTNLREGGAILVKKPWTLGNPRHKRL